ncbi:MAG: FAD-dependent monooxygenase [Pseudomonadota bacterium]
MHTQETDILIAGAGPAGLVMALCLAKCGIASIVIERQAGINPHPKAHELNTRSLEILASLGVSTKELRSEASPPGDGCRIAFCQRINEEFGAIDLHRDIDDPGKYQRFLASDEPYLNISQVEIERILHGHCQRNPLIDFRLGHQWDSMEETDAGVVSSVSERDGGANQRILARWLIAADGAGSRVRKAIGIRMEGPEKVQDFVNAYFELNLRSHVKRPAKLYWITEPSAFGTFIAHHIDKRWVYNIPIYEPWETRADYTEAVLSDRIKVALDLPHAQVNIKSTSVWRMTVQVAERWRQGRVFLVGDAAHRFPPTGGLGMNSGIGDAHNLAWKIAQVVREHSPQELLDTYEDERKPVAERNGNESLENFHRIFEVFDSLGLPRKGPERAAMLRNSGLFSILPSDIRTLFTKFVDGLMRKKIGASLSNERQKTVVQESIKAQIPHFDRIGLDLGYVYTSAAVHRHGGSPAPTEVTRYVPTSEPGARFPHVWLESESGKQSSHALLDYGRWTLLTSGALDEESPLELPALHGDRVTHIPVEQLSFSEESVRELIRVSSLCDGGAILVRPDGHVALHTGKNRRDQDSETSELNEGQVTETLAILGLLGSNTVSASSAVL